MPIGGKPCFSHGLLKHKCTPNTNVNANSRAIAYNGSDRHSCHSTIPYFIARSDGDAHHSTIPYFIARSDRNAHLAADPKTGGIALERSRQVVVEGSAKTKRKKSKE